MSSHLSQRYNKIWLSPCDWLSQNATENLTNDIGCITSIGTINEGTMNSNK